MGPPSSAHSTCISHLATFLCGLQTEARMVLRSQPRKDLHRRQMVLQAVPPPQHISGQESCSVATD